MTDVQAAIGRAGGMRDAVSSRALITTDTVGGVWTFSMELARGLAASGWEVCIASLGALPSGDQRAEASAIPRATYFPSRYKLEWMDNPWRDVEASCAWLHEIITRSAPDVVHLNSFGQAALACNVPKVLTAHSCVASWWRAVKKSSLPERFARYTRQVECALAECDVVTAPTKAMAAALALEYGYRPEKVHVIPNGRTTTQFFDLPKEPFVLAAGRLWDEAKNIAVLDNIAAELPWPVFLAGSEDGFHGNRSEYSGCRHLGQLSARRMADAYARASIYVLPCRYEPFGYTPLEVALSKCALVLGDIPSLREVWGDAAIYVSPEDQGQLRQTLNRLIRSEPLRKEMSDRSRRRAQCFSAERMVQSYSWLYRKMLTRRVLCA